MPRLWWALLTQFMLAGVVWELDHEQVPALHAAADAVGCRYVGAPFLSFLQDADHLSVGVVGELYRGAGLLRRRHFHAVNSLYILLCCREKHSESYQLWSAGFSSDSDGPIFRSIAKMLSSFLWSWQAINRMFEESGMYSRNQKESRCSAECLMSRMCLFQLTH